MSAAASTLSQEVVAAVRRQLLRLARLEDDRAATELARVPYWSPCPPSVVGHRVAARLLREEADALLTTFPVVA